MYWAIGEIVIAMERTIGFLRDIVSFMIYILLFFRKRNGRVTLLYHSIGQISPEGDPYRLNILPWKFEKHLKAISENNIDIEITFDDGYGNNFDQAFFLLKKYNMRATIFLITDFIDGRIGSESFAGSGFRARALSWEEIRAMDKEGIQFGSHSKAHARLTKLSKDEAMKELSDSKIRIEEMLGHPIESFAYPFGDASSFNEFTEGAVRDTGYNKAFVNIMGYNRHDGSDRYHLRRVRIYGDDGVLRLKMKISGAYDWIDSLCPIRKIVPDAILTKKE